MNENIITVTGNICTQPELRETRSGSAMLTFRVASTHRYFSNRTGQWEEGVANFYDVAAYRQLALNAGKSLGVGDPVILQGQLKQRRYERQDGSFGMSSEIEARLLGPDLGQGVATFMRAQRVQNRTRNDERPQTGDRPQTAEGPPTWVNTATGEVAPGSPNGSGPLLDPESTAFDVNRDDEPTRSYPGHGAEDADRAEEGDPADSVDEDQSADLVGVGD